MSRISRWCLFLGLFGFVIFSACAAPKAAAPAPVPGKLGTAASAPAAPGADLTREQKLIEGAKKEGELVMWVNSWTPGPVEKAFEAKYPFLKMKVWDGTESVEPLVIEEY